jgi:hypothetical protein
MKKRSSHTNNRLLDYSSSSSNSKNKRKGTQRRWFADITIASLVAVAASAQDDNNLLGVGLREFETFTGKNRLSMMGGAKLLIKADGGLHENAGNNMMRYTTSQVAGLNELYSNLSRDDEFFSAPSDGKLAFTTPSMKELFGEDAELSDFTGFGALPSGWKDDPLQLQTSVMNLFNENAADRPNEPIICQNDSDCLLKYERRFTPLINDIVPNQLYKGHPIDWRVNPMAVHEDWVTPEGRMPMEELSIDGNLNSWADTISTGTRIDNYHNGKLRAYVGDQPPNKYSVPRARFITGDSFIRATAQHCNFADDDCWNVRTHAKIDSISANQGNTNGGQ